MIKEVELDPDGSLTRRWATPGRITVVLVDEVLGF
jgi:hypothetical protein